MTRGRKITLGAAGGLTLLILAAAIVVPHLVDLDRYRPQVIAGIQARTGKPARIGHLALSLVPALRIRADDFALGEPPGFPEGDLINARRVFAQVDARALWNHRVLIRSLEIDQPVIRLLSDARGKWNYENRPNAAITEAAARSQSQGPSAFAVPEIPKVKITGGHLTVARLLPNGQAEPRSVEVRGLSSHLEHVLPSAFGAPKAESPATFRGLAAPGGPPFPAMVYGAANAPAQQAPVALGTLEAEAIQVGRLAFAEVKSSLEFLPQEGLFHHLSFDCFKGHGSGTVSISIGPPSVTYVAQVKLSGIDMASLLAAFPEGRGKMTGQMEGELNLSGETVPSSDDPLAGKRGVGHLIIRNGQLPTLQLKKNLLLLASLINLGPSSGVPSSFSSLSTDLNISNSKITSNKIMVLGNGLEIDGSGTLALEGEGSLDYQGIARIAAGQNAITNLLAGLSGATFAEGKLALPFTLGGTPQHPAFRLNSKAGAQALTGPQNVSAGTGGQPGQPAQKSQDPVRSLGDLFKKKKKQ